MPTLPTSGTDVRFISGIPFTSDYKHTRWFGSKAEQTVYFDNQTVRHTESEVVFTGSKENWFDIILSLIFLKANIDVVFDSVQYLILMPNY